MRDGLQTVKHFVALEPDLGLPFSAHEYESLLRQASPLADDPRVDENDPAELFYTSGTTGKPKGVVLTPRSLYPHALYATIALRQTDDTVLLHVVPMFHVNGWGSPHTTTGTGGTHVMLRKIDPLEIFRLIQAERGRTNVPRGGRKHHAIRDASFRKEPTR
jgi:fatty-acyl-CoA synthase